MFWGGTAGCCTRHTTAAARPRCCRSLGRVARRDRLIFRGCERCCKSIGGPIGPMELETHANGRQDAAHV